MVAGSERGQERRRSVKLRIIASAEVVCIHVSQIFYFIWQEAVTSHLRGTVKVIHIRYYYNA